MIKPIAITGGCGYVGSRVAKALASEGLSVVVLDRIAPKERGIVFPELVSYKQVNLKDYEKTLKTLNGVGVVLHIAANIGALSYMHEHQAEIISDNTAVDASLYPAMLEAGVKAVVYSSSSMVFQNAPRYPYTEEDLKNTPPPTNVYGFSKLAGEYFCRAYHAQYGLPYVIIRYHNIYGPGEDSKGGNPGDIHVILALMEKVLSGQYPLRLLGGLEATRPFTYIDDAVHAIVMITKKTLEKDSRVLNNDFNIGPSRATRILDLAELIWRLLGDGRPFKYEVEDTKADTSLRREINPEKIKSIIGWEPQISLEEGIKRTAEWMKSQKSPLIF